MRITDDLREWGSRWEDAVAREVSEIADRIDAEHQAACAAAYQRGYDEGEEAGDTLLVDAADLEARVERIERLLNHKGAE